MPCFSKFSSFVRTQHSPAIWTPEPEMAWYIWENHTGRNTPDKHARFRLTLHLVIAHLFLDAAAQFFAAARKNTGVAMTTQHPPVTHNSQLTTSRTCTRTSCAELFLRRCTATTTTTTTTTNDNEHQQRKRWIVVASSVHTHGQ